MCRCSAAIAGAVVAFLDAVLVGCLLSCYRPRPRHGSRRPDALAHKDRAAEVLWVDERGLGRSGKSHEDLTDSGDIDEEALMKECGNMPTNAPATKLASLFGANSSEGCEVDHAPSELDSEDTRHHLGVESVDHSAFLEKSPFQNIQHKLHDCTGSPFVTPLVLRDDMHTPGTVYTSHRGASMSGKRVQTRKQFIYPVLRPIENRVKQMEQAEDSSPLLPSNPSKKRILEEDSVMKPKQTSSNSVAKSGLFGTPPISRQVKDAPSPELLDGGELSKTKSDEKNAALSLSHWVKSSSKDVENQGDAKVAVEDQSYDECIFPVERHVFMDSDLNCIENPTPKLHKTFDGNGIPNTTTRYKEDQRVSWHTTPFEERLLKVLSDEKHHAPRKVFHGKLFHQEEKAE